MASVGHVAVGLLVGQIHGGGDAPGGGKRASFGTMAAFAGLAMLPDVDIFLVALGADDAGALGHRGASHSLPLALVVGLMAAYAAQRIGWPVVRTAIAATVAVASHALLDLLAHGGRGLPLLWPYTETRFQLPLRILPDAPKIFSDAADETTLLSRLGMVNLAIELAVFFPLIAYALWPRLTTVPVARLFRRGVAVKLVSIPERVVEPAAPPDPDAVPVVVSTAEFGPPGAADAPPAVSDPPQRSADQSAS
jgi:inner membrane protein